MDVDEQSMNTLDLLVDIISKEVKEEPENCRQVILVMLSAWTKNPQNLRILAPSGEGKTYLVTKVAKLFPQDRVMILQNATPQSFKYLNTKKVIESSPGVFGDYQDVIDKIEDEKEKKLKIRELQSQIYDLVDFSGKILVFVDAQSFHLWESLKPVLSHDQKILKNFSVNKSKSGTIQAQKVIFQGHPTVIYCSAKDEQALDQTDEINTRFNTISLNSSPKKYRQMLKLSSLKSSLPDCIYREEVISEADLEHARQIIEGMISNAERFEVFNPFADEIQKQFSEDAGYRTRQLGILLANINLHTLSNAKYRPKFVYNGMTCVVSSIVDVIEANKLTKKPTSLPPAKIQFFNRYIRSVILELGNQRQLVDDTIKCLTASEIADYAEAKGIATDRKKLQETFLKPLADHGYLEEFQDPKSRNRNVYSLPAKYHNAEATPESPLIDNFDIDCSRVSSFVDRFLTRRLESGKLEDEIGNTITPNQLLNILLNRQLMPENTHESDIVETSTHVDGEYI
jgi:hypothetical protein